MERAKRHVPAGQTGASSRARRTLPGCVHRWTSARNRPQKSHFVSLFGPSGVTFQRRTSISKLLHAKQIGPDSWSSRASKTPCGTWDPEFSYRFPLIVQYLRTWSVGRGPWKKTWQGSQNPARLPDYKPCAVWQRLSCGDDSNDTSSKTVCPACADVDPAADRSVQSRKGT